MKITAFIPKLVKSCKKGKLPSCATYYYRCKHSKECFSKSNPIVTI